MVAFNPIEPNGLIKDPTRVNASVVERHVLLIHDQSADPLLTVPRRKLVPQFWSPCLADQHLDQGLVILGVADHHFVNVPGQRRFVSHRRIFVRHGGGLACERVVVGVRRRLLIHVDIPRVDSFPNTGETVQLDDIVLFLDRAILVYRCVREPIEPRTNPEIRKCLAPSGKRTYVPLGYFRMSVMFLRNT